MTQQQFIDKLCEVYGSDYLQALLEHYPQQFTQLIKINFYHYIIVNHGS